MKFRSPSHFPVNEPSPEPPERQRVIFHIFQLDDPEAQITTRHGGAG